VYPFFANNADKLELIVDLPVPPLYEWSATHFVIV
jgi:hypothetical protein